MACGRAAWWAVQALSPKKGSAWLGVWRLGRCWAFGCTCWANQCVRSQLDRLFCFTERPPCFLLCSPEGRDSRARHPALAVYTTLSIQPAVQEPFTQHTWRSRAQPRCGDPAPSQAQRRSGSKVPVPAAPACEQWRWLRARSNFCSSLPTAQAAATGACVQAGPVGATRGSVPAEPSGVPTSAAAPATAAPAPACF